ncbi:MAG: hypothetical protein ABIN67_03370 [Ferruginibacter sp.]
MPVTAYSSPSPLSNKKLYTILKATLIAGSLDIIFALTQFYIKTQKSPVLVLRYIASAVFGKSANNDGAVMPAVGLLFHYLVVLGWVTIFFLIYPKIILVIKNSIVAGLLYAIVIWLGMSFVVLPLTLVPSRSLQIQQALIAILILMVAIGLPLGLIMKKYYQRPQ